MPLKQCLRLINLLQIIFLCTSGVAAQLCNSSDPASGLMTASLSAYAVFVGSGYTFSGAINSTTITGDIASYPTASPLNGNVMVVLHGTEVLSANINGPLSSQLMAMYNNALAKLPRIAITGDIGGKTLNAGVYYSQTTIGVTGNVILDANNDPNAVFIIIAGTATTFAANSQIILSNGALCCRVFWIFGSSATIGANSMIVGNMIAYASITLGAGCNITGSIYAFAAVTFNNNTVSVCSCSLSSASLAQCTSVPSPPNSAPPPPPPPASTSSSSSTSPPGSSSSSSSTGSSSSSSSSSPSSTSAQSSTTSSSSSSSQSTASVQVTSSALVVQSTASAQTTTSGQSTTSGTSGTSGSFGVVVTDSHSASAPIRAGIVVTVVAALLAGVISISY